MGATGVAGHALTLDPVAVGALVLAAGAASKLPDKLEGGLIPHRTLTHSAPVAAALLIAGVIAAAQAAMLPVTLAVVGIVAGYWLHLAADACTPHGIPGWPVRERLWLLPRSSRIVTGSRREATFVFFWCVGCLCVLAFT
jgi:membrane-bound metal-dependent hydrolase YbcI (DUF457 family)